jgi:hypothetical protein
MQPASTPINPVTSALRYVDRSPRSNCVIITYPSVKRPVTDYSPLHAPTALPSAVPAGADLTEACLDGSVLWSEDIFRLKTDILR